MRESLIAYEKREITVIGKFERYGKKQDDEDLSAWNTLLLTDIKLENGTEITDHLWFMARQSFLKKAIPIGSTVKVRGVVRSYSRKNNSHDYGIEDCLGVEVLRYGNELVPCKVWDANGHRYLKFILDSGTCWYRVKNAMVEQVKFVFNGKDFDEVLVPTPFMDSEVQLAIEKRVGTFKLQIGKNGTEVVKLNRVEKLLSKR